MKKTSLLVIGALVVVTLLFFFILNKEEEPVLLPIEESAVEISDPRIESIGESVEGRAIETYTYGEGDTLVLFVGGIHGGYEWNSVALAYEYIDYLIENPESIPEDVTVAIIPDLNPDGTFTVVKKEGRFLAEEAPTAFEDIAPGRFNANGVDLNRNFDCNWQPQSTWRGEVVSGGESVFSEPEALALKRYVEENNPAAAVFWHSKANAVYGSFCGEEEPLPETLRILDVYASAAGYKAIEAFDAYPVTGAAEDWLASIGIPAITVELVSHQDVEFEKNLKGIEALLLHYGK